jgi:CubicO group peptidase (beta-lactamase class C family)
LLRFVLIFVAVFLLLGVGAAAWLCISEWTFIDRMRHYPANLITDVDWYVPKESVPGGGGAPLPRALTAEIRIRPEALEAAAKLADAKNASAFLVAQDDKVVLERHWRGHHPGDLTNSASMAKTIMSLLIGIARDEGRIRSLDEPAATWLPAWRDDHLKKITLRHLLQMHSGLQPQGEYEDPFSDAAYLVLGTDMRYVVDNVPLVEEPGKRFDYNNANFQALGYVLEAATGQRFASYLSEKLWKPLGAADGAVWLDRLGGDAHTFGFIFATPEDWIKVGLMFLHEGTWNGRQLVSREYLREMRVPSPTEPRYGLGLWLAHNPFQLKEQEETFLADGIYYLDGHSKQRVYMVPSQSLVVVRVGENGRGWDEAALVNAVLRGLLPPVEVSAESKTATSTRASTPEP